jgi:hypothetical protein
MDWQFDNEQEENNRSLAFLKDWDKVAFFNDFLSRTPVFIVLAVFCLFSSYLILALF